MRLESRDDIPILVSDSSFTSKSDEGHMKKATNASTSNKVPPFVALHIWKKI